MQNQETLATQLRKQAILYSKVKHLDDATVAWYLKNIDKLDIDNLSVGDNHLPNKASVK